MLLKFCVSMRLELKSFVVWQGVSEMIAMVLGTRSAAQVRSHVQKFYLRKERIRQRNQEKMP